MAALRKLMVLTAAAEAARRYATRNPEKVREFADKAAVYADRRTNGKYTRQINTTRQRVTELAGVPSSPVPHGGDAGPIRASATATPVRPTPYKRP